MDSYKFETDHSICYQANITTRLEPFMFRCVEDVFTTDFLDILHVKRVPTFDDFIQILSKIKEKTDENSTSNCDNEVNMTVLILYHLMDCHEMLQLYLKDNNNHLFIPNTKNVWLSHRDLCFCNVDWIDKSDLNICHEKISIDLAMRLGIQNNQDKYIQAKSIGIGEEFGQSEDLICRIKTLLRAYPNDGTIIKEIIQNADDAGATEIQFILDDNEYGDEKIFGDSWKPLQKCPALLVYNNGKFQNEDFKGIQKLGEGSKKADVTKVGEFGVGFNCVYHLTDVPIIVANHEKKGLVFCVFDPHRSYFPNSENFFKPGRMIPLESMKLYSDVLQTIPKGFDLKNGVLFRFPLRDSSMATKSKLSDKPLLFDKAEEMLKEHFCKTAKECFFFLNSIQKIEFKKKTHNSYKILSCISTSKEMFSENYQQTSFTQEMYNKHHYNPISLCYYLNINDLEEDQKWLIYRSYGFREKDNLPNDFNDKKYNPEAGVALPIKLEKGIEIKKKIFCHLPLPIESYMPIHINGRFYLDHENRRGIRQNFDSDNTEDIAIEEKWNLYIFTELIGYCYARIIEQLQMLVVKRELTFYDFYNFFPLLREKNPLLNGLCKGLMNNLRQSKIFAFKSSNSSIEWLSYNEHNDKYLLYFKSLYSNDIVDILKDIGMKVTQVPSQLKQIFKKGDMNIYDVNPMETVKFLLSKYHCIGKVPRHINKTPFRNLERFLKFIEFIPEKFDFEMENDPQGLPLFLNEENVLNVFDSDDLIIATEYPLLFQNMKRNVVNKNILNTGLVSKLIETGIVEEDTVELLAEHIEFNILEELKKSTQILEYHKKYEDYITNFWKWVNSYRYIYHEDSEGLTNVLKDILHKFSNYSLLLYCSCWQNLCVCKL
ncbi:unnamed protein product [Dimorphilus gyrociliatus]|uniref:Sacsin/Nov domain-containing protein n=1 Tax=Dimorphilus gyrociliatus TaxID=2664684 RepID=A0A7I8WEE2_9ANNE|nr:unnamed protein product [Dimorphilus gyrociliatus]